MCHPRNDQLIVSLIAEGRLMVDTQGMGTLWMRDGRTGRVRRATEHVEQAGKRPAAAEYRKIIVRIDGHVRSLRVHRIVYVAAFGPTELEIDHLDDDPLNCGIRQPLRADPNRESAQSDVGQVAARQRSRSRGRRV